MGFSESLPDVGVRSFSSAIVPPCTLVGSPTSDPSCLVGVGWGAGVGQRGAPKLGGAALLVPTRNPVVLGVLCRARFSTVILTRVSTYHSPAFASHALACFDSSLLLLPSSLHRVPRPCRGSAGVGARLAQRVELGLRPCPRSHTRGDLCKPGTRAAGGAGPRVGGYNWRRRALYGLWQLRYTSGKRRDAPRCSLRTSRRALTEPLGPRARTRARTRHLRRSGLVCASTASSPRRIGRGVVLPRPI